jgi:hypothetical protein
MSYDRDWPQHPTGHSNEKELAQVVIKNGSVAFPFKGMLTLMQEERGTSVEVPMKEFSGITEDAE